MSFQRRKHTERSWRVGSLGPHIHRCTGAHGQGMCELPNPAPVQKEKRD